MGNNTAKIAGQICKVEGCEKPVRSLNLCRAHHLRQWRHGSPNGGGLPRGQAQKFILDHVNHASEECLIWPYYRNPSGYGDVSFPGMRNMLAHRVMCVLAHGEPPTLNLDAAHSCGKGHEGCVNPSHLSWKTPSENIKDKRLHGTQIWGEAVHLSKLKIEQVLFIKYYSSETNAELARRFNVTASCIHSIRANQNWKDV